MSRGHGRIQLQVLEYLLRYDESARARGHQDAYVAIADIAGRDASRSRIESVRRAAKSLAEEGLILLRSDESRPRAAGARRLGSVGHSYGLVARLASPSDYQDHRQDVATSSELSA
jgi:hypothetical protein